MLASTPPPVYSWIAPGLLAFSSGRPSNAKKEGQSCCSSLLHTCLLSPQVTRCAYARERPGTVIGAASNVFRRPKGLGCLRGGSGDEGDVQQKPEGDGQSTSTAPNVDTQAGKQGQQAPAAGFRSQQGAPTGGVFSGVALVTERSTATGGSTGRRCYSVLPDGTLRVGPRSSVSTHTTIPAERPHTPRRCSLGYRLCSLLDVEVVYRS